MLKTLRASIVFLLCHIFNTSILEGKFPDRMKIAEVIPLYKGKSMDKMINYRPISLLVMLSKVLEKIMYRRLYKFLEEKSILYPSQYGFCSKRSCEQAVIQLTGYVLQAMNHCEHVASVFLDLSKAFDTLDHKILIEKLERYGIRGVVRAWFEDYLRDRKLVAKITTSPCEIVKSESFDVTYGAVQGSCLGPLLFIIFVNDLHLQPLHSNIILFADDTTIFSSNKSKSYLQYMMEHDLCLMQSWFSANKLSLNISKTVAIKFWHNSSNFRVSINNKIVPTVDSTKFLGLHTDSTLSWHYHMNHLINRLNKCLLMMSRNLLNTQCLKNVYFSHIHSHLNYGLTVWGSMGSATEINSL